MNRIFDEIKKAIEEEMRNAESGPPPAGGRSQGGGGRRAQEYADWLTEEQERLRGGESGQAVRQPKPLQDVEVEAPQEQDEEWVPLRERRQQRGEERQQEREQRRQRQQQQRNEERSRNESRPRQEERRRGRRRRAASSSSRMRSAGQMGNQIENLLRSPNGLRQAFLLREIIDKPVSLRDQDDHLIS